MLFMIFLILFVAVPLYGLAVLTWNIAYKMKINNLIEGIRSKEDIQDLSYKDFPHIMAEVFRRKGHQVKLTDKCGEYGNGLILDELQYAELWKHGFRQLVEVETAMKLVKCMQNNSIYRGMLVSLGDFKQSTRLYCHKNVITCVNGDQLLAMCRDVQKRERFANQWG